MLIYQVDAFTDHVFGGNPAAVMLPPTALATSLMQSIAAENNLSETAFIWPHIGESLQDYDIRWFTPQMEVGLCGHATLAAAHVVFERQPELATVNFHCQRGVLQVWRDGQQLCMRLPEDRPQCMDIPNGISNALAAPVLECWRGRDDMLVLLADDSMLIHLQPDLQAIAALPVRGVIITASANEAHPADIVSRFFAPQSGIAEDPVTGSAHALLVPFWAERLACKQLEAEQLSSRGGKLSCQWRSPWVYIRGDAVTYLRGEVSLM